MEYNRILVGRGVVMVLMGVLELSLFGLSVSVQWLH